MDERFIFYIGIIANDLTTANIVKHTCHFSRGIPSEFYQWATDMDNHALSATNQQMLDLTTNTLSGAAGRYSWR